MILFYLWGIPLSMRFWMTGWKTYDIIEENGKERNYGTHTLV